MMDDGVQMSTQFRVSNLGYGGWPTLIALLLIFIFHSAKRFFSFSSKRPTVASASDDNLQFGISEVVSELDLKFLIENLDDNLVPTGNEKWENVIHKTTHSLSYTAKCCKPKDAPIKYLSVTVFENCSPEIIVHFYMDNHYRKQWDNTLLLHEQLQVDISNATEFGRTIKKFPLLTPREYVLAWRLWEAKDKTFFCFIKECEHPLVPRQRKYVRVGFFRSGWRIRKVAGRNACEIKMYHQEDAGLNVEMAKLAFGKGIWNYVRKMDNALRKYNAVSHPQMAPAVTALSLIQKVPSALEQMNIVGDTLATPADESKERKLPIRKVFANGLLLLGGVICLSHGHSRFGAKVAVAYILTKLRKRDASSGQIRER